jgi:hypothetical protein
MRLVFIFLAIIFQSELLAQTYNFYQTENIYNQLRLNSKTGEVYQIQNDGQTFLVQNEITPENELYNRYSLEKTENMWTYILLDKVSGKLWQCQYSVQGEAYRHSWIINPNSLSETPKSKFNIQPLISMFQYYLVNEETGEMWKFQWSTKGDEYRWIEKVGY